jgi:CotS family spore coat protein
MEYPGSADKACLQDKLLKQIASLGKVITEEIIPCKDGKLLVQDHDGVSYLLKTHFDGVECNIRDPQDCTTAVELLATLHSCMELTEPDCEGIIAHSPGREFEKHTREMKKVKHYLLKKRQKTHFEFELLQNLDYFIDQAGEVYRHWKEYQTAIDAAQGSYPKIFCHGDYQHHNILKKDRQWAVLNFERCVLDDPVRDLYLFMRKLLEKNDWSIPLGKQLLRSYQAIRPISLVSWIDLTYRFIYPEKFWKILNFYFNTGRSFISERNQEKLDKLLAQEKLKQDFINEVFREL